MPIPSSRNGHDSEVFHVPVGELKAPRKQVLASRIGVSSKAPIIKTITRERGVEVIQTGAEAPKKALPLLAPKTVAEPSKKALPLLAPKPVVTSDDQPFTIEEVEMEPAVDIESEPEAHSKSDSENEDEAGVEIEDVEMG